MTECCRHYPNATENMTNAALIARLKAEGGSRALSDRVLLALGWKTGLGTHVDRDKWHPPPDSLHLGVGIWRPDPTRDLQAAVALVPSKWGWSIEGTGGGLIYRKEKVEGEHGHPILAETDGGRPPPIGMCILILNAMETESAGDG